ncbi:hypothetical protein [Gloeobacter violaceus]|nr:hypothetical protein [Gloeobacter violaceus]
MIRPTSVLAALALVALAVPAVAVEKGIPAQGEVKTIEQDLRQAQANRVPGSVVFAAGLECIDNPKFHPANDGNGPRASESYSDSTPYAATPAILASEACHK